VGSDGPAKDSDPATVDTPAIPAGPSAPEGGIIISTGVGLWLPIGMICLGLAMFAGFGFVARRRLHDVV
jgi:hypothetical protein